jgi:hypothetical protein
MPNVLIRDLPPQVHARLVERARANGQSLQQYLVAQLTRLSAEPTMDDVLDRIEAHTGGRVPLSDVVEDIRARRDAR